ncbi:MAG TPA: prepilin-type N-terminal cleavage/methylation domain-containing protein [Vicinamibacterales bacterium]|nr:prepilin-type N-terminal cleavage/methylation domain-containing protein [Vicinamibacterales bacterium]
MTPVKDERGFSLTESLIALGVLSTGMLAIAAGFLQGTMQLTGSELDIVAREKAAEAVESVFTARDTRTVQWVEIRNADPDEGTGGGVFLDGPQPLRRPGSDGLVNTADDPEELESITRPGPDGMLGTEDDVVEALGQFTREVIIRDVNTTLRELQVVISYNVGGVVRRYEIRTLISSYA